MYVILLILLRLSSILSYATTQVDEADDYPTLTSQTDYSETDDSATQSVNEDLYDSRKLFSTPPKITQINSNLNVTFYCEVDKTYCAKVQTALISAATALAQVINLKNGIVIQTSYYSFCKNVCANSTFGWGTPSSQFKLTSLQAVDSNFLYPQALAKQLTLLSDSTSWSKYDIAIDINHDIYMNAVDYDSISDTWNGTGIPPGGGYWFTNDTDSIQDTQVDLEYVILHQMIHGLGMASSWAPYFSHSGSPFAQLLTDLVPADSLEIMTPSPYWYVNQYTGPTYITGFQTNMIFDKFLYLLMPASNQTSWLVDIGFDMQNFCVEQNDAFILNFMNAFLNNATQSSLAKSIYVSMSVPETLTFEFESHANTSVYYNNTWLNQTYKSIQLMTGPNIFSSGSSSSGSSGNQEAYYRPGISNSHLDDKYIDTPDFLMTYTFVKGKTLQELIDNGYADVPDITYNVTYTYTVNVTTNTTSTNNATFTTGHSSNSGNTSATTLTAGNRTTITNVTTTIPQVRSAVTEYVYKSAIGPGILRILETIGYSTVLTNTNYSIKVTKTNKPETTCDDTNSNNFKSRPDDSISSTSMNTSGAFIRKYNGYKNSKAFLLLLLTIIIQV